MPSPVYDPRNHPYSIEAALQKPPANEDGTGGRSPQDPDADWTKKRGKYHVGYKAHVGIEQGSELARKISMTPAHVHDGNMFESALSGDEDWAFSDISSKYFPFHQPLTCTNRWISFLLRNMKRWIHILWVLLLCPCLAMGQGAAQTPSEAPDTLEVRPTAQDIEIQQRLQGILKTTGWFQNPHVEVKDGVVFLYGKTKNDEFKKWAASLARNTQNVAAVVNQIEIEDPSIWDFAILWQGLRYQGKRLIKIIPSILVGIIILVIAWGMGILGMKAARRILEKKQVQPLLQEILAKVVGGVFFLVGVYVIFEIADLTHLAVTVLSGTGLLGIILGIAFRDITENFLASILLSIQNPFRSGDLIEVAGILGFVQRLTMRATFLVSLEGNHLQIPNAMVYKSTIRNFTSNPNRREEFTIGIGLQDSIATAQEIALKVLEKHEAILQDPEPLVLMEGFGRSSVTLRVYFWMDASRYSILKVKSSLMRLIKVAFQEKHISIPDEGRERLFPQTLSVHLLKEENQVSKVLSNESKVEATSSESGFENEAQQIQEQAAQSQRPEEGKNFLNKEEPKP